MKYLYLLTFSGCLLALFSCKKPQDPVPADPANPSEAYTARSVAYGSHSQQKMDIYLPAGRSDRTKTLVLIHGGGWTSGARADMEPFVDTQLMAEMNMAMVNIDYRLATETEFKHPAQMEDIGLALDFIRSKAAEWTLNPDTFALAGASAGGHLSILYDYGFDTGNRVQAVINLVGPTNFVTPAILTDTLLYLTVWGYLGKTHWEDMALWQDASPYWHTGTHCAPTYQFMGDADPIVPYAQGLELKARLDSLGVENHWQLYTGAGHGWWPGSAYFNDTKNKMKQFLLEKLY